MVSCLSSSRSQDRNLYLWRSMAHAMRAVLLANCHCCERSDAALVAIPVTQRLSRSSLCFAPATTDLAPCDHRTLSQINITPMLLMPSRRSLSPELCCLGVMPMAAGHLPALAVLPRIDGGDHGRGYHRTHTTQLLQAHAVFVVRDTSRLII